MSIEFNKIHFTFGLKSTIVFLITLSGFVWKAALAWESFCAKQDVMYTYVITHAPKKDSVLDNLVDSIKVWHPVALQERAEMKRKVNAMWEVYNLQSGFVTEHRLKNGRIVIEKFKTTK